MRRDPRVDLFDVLQAARNVERAVGGRSRDAFEADEIIQWAVERQLEVVGEALDRLRQDDPAIAARIPETWPR